MPALPHVGLDVHRLQRKPLLLVRERVEILGQYLAPVLEVVEPPLRRLPTLPTVLNGDPFGLELASLVRKQLEFVDQRRGGIVVEQREAFRQIGPPSVHLVQPPIDRLQVDLCRVSHQHPLHFESVEEARQTIEQWRVEYNTERPHRSLKQQTPAAFAPAWTAPSESPD